MLNSSCVLGVILLSSNLSLRLIHSFTLKTSEFVVFPKAITENNNNSGSSHLPNTAWPHLILTTPL